VNLPRKWIKPLARAGYSARGLVYVIIGLFALLAAFGAAESKDSEGALEKLLQQPFGTLLIWVLIVGLAGYVLWRLVQSLFDTDDHGHGPKGLAVRGGLLASAFTYSALALFALSLLGVTSANSETDSGGLAGALAGFVSSHWISLALAVIFSGVAAAHFRKAWTRRYQDHFEASGDAMKFIDPISIIGLTARGIIFIIIAILFVYRFLNAETGSGGNADTPGLKDALEFIRDLPAGTWLLAAIGLGLIAFAAYSFIEAWWRRINVEDA